MECEEPSTGLVNAFGDEVCRINETAVKFLLMFERIVNLCIRHSTRVEPHVDKVCFTFHRQTALRYQDNVIHIRTMQVYLVIILFGVNTGDEAVILIGIGLHKTCCNSFFNFVVQLFNRTDADLFLIFRTPDR